VLLEENSERDYHPLRAYFKTKLANMLFTREPQSRAGHRLLAVACHPGLSRAAKRLFEELERIAGIRYPL
jgi:hypothetical protein